MPKYTKEFKLLAAKRYENEIISYRDLAKQVGVDDSVIRYWVMLFRHHGDQAFDFPYTNYSSAFKLRVIQFINETNYSIREASAIFHIPDPSMVRRWKKKWEISGVDALESREKGPTIMKSRNQKKNTSKNLANLSREDMEKHLLQYRKQLETARSRPKVEKKNYIHLSQTQGTLWISPYYRCSQGKRTQHKQKESSSDYERAGSKMYCPNEKVSIFQRRIR